MTKKLIIATYFLSAIIAGALTGIGFTASIHEIFCEGASRATVAERPVALYKEVFFSQALSQALQIKQEGSTLKVSEMLAMAAVRSSFGHYPTDPSDCVISVIGDAETSEFEREMIRELNLTKYDILLALPQYK